MKFISLNSFFVMAFLFTGLADFVLPASAQSGVPLWTNRYNGSGNAYDSAAAIALDGSGNVFVTGRSWNGTSYDSATIKYSGAGVPVWTNSYKGLGNGNDATGAIAVDGNGNAFVAGYSFDINSGDNDYVTICYSSAGVPLWTNFYTGPVNGANGANAVAVDNSGNVFVTGTSTGSGTGYDYATLKYSGAGVPLWANRYNGPGNTDDFSDARAFSI